ncbi:MAG: 3-phosphoshikimate 1-carboxyvinyltransferase [Fibrobacter sp.]|nr:3-phosphoshikimate 1-carboxyvinyltransferase [Fibrobacter sp.]
MKEISHLTLSPAAKFSGEIVLPGSKSMSNRALLLAALSTGTTEIKNLLTSDDTEYMQKALLQLGVEIIPTGPVSVKLKGVGQNWAQKERAEFYLGNAGTAMRSLTAALCLGRGDFTLTGDPRMLERPIGDLVDALRQAGANIDYLGQESYPPMRIQARGLQGGTVRIKGNTSSQYLSALLMAGPYAAQPLTIEVEGELISKPYVNITLNEMRRFGINVENDDFKRFVVPQGSYVSPGVLEVEGDASAASYFLAGAALAHGPVRVKGAGRSSVQGDVLFAEVLQKMGAQVEWGPDWIEVRGGTLRGVDLDLNHIPDAAMTLVPLALFAQGSTTLRNIGSWRVKETDRIHAMATEARKIGAQVEEGPDYLVINPRPVSEYVHTDIDTYDDHRMAMSFALVSLGGISVTINDPKCVEKTFPNYFAEFQKMLSYN